MGRERKRDGQYFAAAPTRDQAKKIWWKDLVALTPKSWVASYAKGELSIITKWGAALSVIGLDVPARMEGTPWQGGVIDEFANCKRGLWDANIRPALSTKDEEGWCWIIGVPDRDSPGQVDYEKMNDAARAGTDPEWGSYTWPSSDILSPNEVASAKRRMDRRMFDQEYGGLFVLASGRAFPDFDSSIHASWLIPYEPSLPLCLSCDFNVNPMCWGVIQHHHGEVRVIDELVLEDSRTIPACKAFLSRASGNGWDLVGLTVYGDASGKARDSTSSESDWQQIRNEFLHIPGVSYRVPLANPSIKDTVNAVNAKVMSADGAVSLLIDPDCVVLIDNLRSALWPSSNDLREEHCLAWLRYFIQEEYPIESNEPPPSSQIVFAGGPHALRRY